MTGRYRTNRTVLYLRLVTGIRWVGGWEERNDYTIYMIRYGIVRTYISKKAGRQAAGILLWMEGTTGLVGNRQAGRLRGQQAGRQFFLVGAGQQARKVGRKKATDKQIHSGKSFKAASRKPPSRLKFSLMG